MDLVRRLEVDGFYNACQRHREQYKDHTGRLHPLCYFQIADKPWHCPYGPEAAYMRTPVRFHRQGEVPVLPRTFERMGPFPDLPHRTLVGTYSKPTDTHWRKN